MQPNRRTVQPLAVTGIGVYTPIGKNHEEFWQSVAEGVCGVKKIEGFPVDDLRVKHAAEITDHDPTQLSEAEQKFDWTAQFGLLAARQAIADSGLSDEVRQSSRLGLVVGVCAGGQGTSPPERTPENTFDVPLRDFPDTAIYRQTDAIGASLGIHGPRSTVSTACASSGTALAYAYDLLQDDTADALLVGGTDAFSMSTYAGFYALGAMPERPISPFSENTGVSFGEGSGFVVLEPLAKAQARGAQIYGLLLGYGSTGDAHHVTAPHPSGEGLHRAMNWAVQRGELSPETIDYVNAHGTATRDNDRAESSAIRELFGSKEAAPPVSSSKSQFGHTLGAAGILEFIVSVLATRESVLPPTVNFEAARNGCDLDYVPNQSRPGKIDTFLSNSAAFGGINVSVLGGSLKHEKHQHSQDLDDICITGVGVVSPIGSGYDTFIDSLRDGKCGIGPISEFSTEGCSNHQAALMGKFKTRKLAPTLDVRRTDPLNRYAMVASALALKHADLDIRPSNTNRVGMVMSINHGSLAVQERFRDSLRDDGLEKLSAKHFPSMVVSTVGGTVAQSFGLRGFNSTVVDGHCAGLGGLIHAATVLRADSSLDAIVVVAADEVAQVFHSVYDERGWLKATGRDEACSLDAYGPSAGGMLLGEGSVAIVLERRQTAAERGATNLAALSGHAIASSGTLFPAVPATPQWHQHAIQQSLAAANCQPSDIDLVFGHGRGDANFDRLELDALAGTFTESTPHFSCLSGYTGVAAATSGLYSVAAAIAGFAQGDVFPVLGSDWTPPNWAVTSNTHQTADISRAIITGSSENGTHSSIVLTQPE